MSTAAYSDGDVDGDRRRRAAFGPIRRISALARALTHDLGALRRVHLLQLRLGRQPWPLPPGVPPELRSQQRARRPHGVAAAGEKVTCYLEKSTRRTRSSASLAAEVADRRAVRRGGRSAGASSRQRSAERVPLGDADSRRAAAGPESYVKSTVTARIEDRLRVDQRADPQPIAARADHPGLQPLRRARSERRHGRRRRSDAARHRRQGRARRRVPRQLHQRRPATGAEGHRAAGVAVHRREPARSRSVRPRARTSSSTPSSKTRGAGWSSTRRSSRSTSARMPASCRRRSQANLQAIQSAQLQLQALSESIDRDRDRRLVLERQVADLQDAVAARRRWRRRVRRRAAGGDDRPSSSTRRRRACAPQLQLQARASGRQGDEGASSAIWRPSCRPKRPARTAPAGRRRRAVSAAGGRAAEPAARSERGNRRISIAARAQARRRSGSSARDCVVPGEGRRGADARIGADRADARLRHAAEDLHEPPAKREDSKVAANLERARSASSSRCSTRRASRAAVQPGRPEDRSSPAPSLGLASAWPSSACSNTATRRFKTEDDVQQLLQLPVLALIPMMASEREAACAGGAGMLLILVGAAVVVISSAVAVVLWKFQIVG